jgi:hypothetical protein
VWKAIAGFLLRSASLEPAPHLCSVAFGGSGKPVRYSCQGCSEGNNFIDGAIRPHSGASRDEQTHRPDCAAMRIDTIRRTQHLGLGFAAERTKLFAQLDGCAFAVRSLRHGLKPRTECGSRSEH